jgi:hypothetical protein
MKRSLTPEEDGQCFKRKKTEPIRSANTPVVPQEQSKLTDREQQQQDRNLKMITDYFKRKRSHFIYFDRNTRTKKIKQWLLEALLVSNIKLTSRMTKEDIREIVDNLCDNPFDCRQGIKLYSMTRIFNECFDTYDDGQKCMLLDYKDLAWIVQLAHAQSAFNDNRTYFWIGQLVAKIAYIGAKEFKSKHTQVFKRESRFTAAVLKGAEQDIKTQLLRLVDISHQASAHGVVCWKDFIFGFEPTALRVHSQTQLQFTHVADWETVVGDFVRQTLRKANDTSAAPLFLPPSHDRQSDVIQTLGAMSLVPPVLPTNLPKLFLVNGGPGTGKTYAIKNIYKQWHSNSMSVCICAAYNKPLQNFVESKENITCVSTLCKQRLKKWTNAWSQPGGGAGGTRLRLLVIDEAGVLGLQDYAEVCAFLADNPEVVCVLVGDYHQLPPIGYGDIFHDLVEKFAEHAPQLLFTLEVNHRQQGDDTKELREEIHSIKQLGSRVHNTTDVAEHVSSQMWKPVSQCRYPAKEEHSITFGHTSAPLGLASQFPGLNNTIHKNIMHSAVAVINTAYILYQNQDVNLVNAYMSIELRNYRKALFDLQPGTSSKFASLLHQLRPESEWTQPHMHPEVNLFAKPICDGFFYFDKVICATSSKLPAGRLYLTQAKAALQVEKGNEGKVMYKIAIHKTNTNSSRIQGFLVQSSEGEQYIGACDAWDNPKAVIGGTITAQKDWYEQGSCEQYTPTKKKQVLIHSEYFTNTDQKLQVLAGFKGKVKCKVFIYPRLDGFMVQCKDGGQFIGPCSVWNNQEAGPGDHVVATDTWQSSGICSQIDLKQSKDGVVATKGAIGIARRVLFFQELNASETTECLEVIGLGGHLYIAPVSKWKMAYAMTVHKAQGSEFDCVVLAANPRDAVPRYLGYRWLYTGLSRAKHKCVLVMSKAHYQEILGKTPDTNPVTLINFSPVMPTAPI